MSAAEATRVQAARLTSSALSVAIADRTLVRQLDFEARGGFVTCVLGRNGAGKTLTMHTLAGLRVPSAGSVMLDERVLAEWPGRALARSVGLLTQTTEDPFPSTVLETVLIGRHPHIGFWQWESNVDRRIASSALAAVGLADLAERDVATLSGGERRRVAIAALLAQDPDVYLLDEPINHLDPHHQLDVLGLMRMRAQDGRAVVMSLHDAGLAARFCDHALLLFGDGEWLAGSTEEVLTEETMTRLYGVSLREIRWSGGRTFVAVGGATQGTP
jgi:iron complex transport system ATP-binding protein